MTLPGRLDLAFTSLRDVVDDVRRMGTHDNAHGLLGRFLAALDEEPLRSLIVAHVPPQGFRAWWNATLGGPHTSGTRTIDWPADMATRVGLQIDACRVLANRSVELIPFLLHHYRGRDRSITSAMNKMGSELLQPLVRDVQRLAALRALPDAVAALVRHRPRSADAELDALLAAACAGIQDPSPAAHQVAIEKLWDAWERAKSLQGGDKKTSTQRLLDAVSTEKEFRSVLENEARALTDIGNTFRIRHHEANQINLTTPEQRDYLFHRMLALLQLTLR